MVYLDFLMELSSDFSVKSFYNGRTVSGRFDASNDIEESRRRLSDPRRSVTIDQVKDFGEKLRNALFANQIGVLFEQAKKKAGDNASVRIMLKTDATFAEYPWEMMCQDGLPLSTDIRTPLFRVFPGSNRSVNIGNKPLKIMVIVSNVEGVKELPYINSDKEIKLIEDGLGGTKQFAQLGTVKDATRTNIEKEISQDIYNIVHFIGHGTFHDNKGYIALSKDIVPPGETALDEADEDVVRHLFFNKKSVGLIILNACSTAVVSTVSKAFTGLAPKLLDSVPAVVAMRQPISNSAATAFARAFYLSLSFRPIAEAIQEARNSMFVSLHCDARDFSIPVLFLGIKDGQITGTVFTKDSHAQQTVAMGSEVDIIDRFYDLKEPLSSIQSVLNHLKAHGLSRSQPSAALWQFQYGQLKTKYSGIIKLINDNFPETSKAVAENNTILDVNISTDLYNGFSESVEQALAVLMNIREKINTLQKMTINYIIKEAGRRAS